MTEIAWLNEEKCLLISEEQVEEENLTQWTHFTTSFKRVAQEVWPNKWTCFFLAQRVQESCEDGFWGVNRGLSTSLEGTKTPSGLVALVALPLF